MQPYIWIAVGSALGGMVRYWCTDAAARLFGDTFPWGTLLVNIAGAFVIGFFIALTGPEGRYVVDQNFRLFVTVGFCGGYTTFSAFSLQTMVLLQEGQWPYAGAYVLASVLVCLLAVWLGHLIAAHLSAL